ncbi:MAG: DNA recombination protein RmuC, partial [Gemmatimonadales bacterium]
WVVPRGRAGFAGTRGTIVNWLALTLIVGVVTAALPSLSGLNRRGLPPTALRAGPLARRFIAPDRAAALASARFDRPPSGGRFAVTITLQQFIILLLASLVAGAIGFLIAQARGKAAVASGAAEAKSAGQKELGALRDELTRAKTESASFEGRLADLARMDTRLRDTFQALSAEALRQNNDAFLLLARTELEKTSVASRVDLAKREQAIQTLVDPIRDQLSKYDAKLAEIDAERIRTSQSLTDQLAQVVTTSVLLGTETQKLVHSLRAPSVRGRWGEVQLKRTVEVAGMLEYCDFTTQESVDTENGRLRPDMTIRLPNEKVIVVDAKTPLAAYLDSNELPDGDQRSTLLAAHARHIRAHVDALGKKAYWDQFGDASPEFVVLFLPGEVFFSAALQADPSLIEETVAQKVIIATPTTLIALLKAVAYGWKQEQITRNAREIQSLGKDLYDRLSTCCDHFSAVGKGLGNAVNAYNKAVGSLETRVMVTARKFGEMGIQDDTSLAELTLVEATVRELQAPEFTGGGEQVKSLPA